MAAVAISHAFDTSHVSYVTLRARVIVAGDAAVGKTSLCRLLASNGSEYPKNYVMTTGIDLSSAIVPVEGASVPTRVELLLLDTPGSSIFNMRDEGTKQWESANMVVLVFDVGNRESFLSAAKWLRRFVDARAGSDTHSSGPKSLRGVLVGNKSDFREMGVDRAEVTSEDAQAFATSVGLAYFETSAESSKDWSSPFTYLAQEWYNKYEAEVAKASAL